MTAEGVAELIGPDDPHPAIDAEQLRLLLREVFTRRAAPTTIGTSTTRDGSERRTVVFMPPERVLTRTQVADQPQSLRPQAEMRGGVMTSDSPAASDARWSLTSSSVASPIPTRPSATCGSPVPGGDPPSSPQGSRRRRPPLPALSPAAGAAACGRTRGRRPVSRAARGSRAGSVRSLLGRSRVLRARERHE